MRQIRLSNGQMTKVDDEDFDYLNQWKWQCSKRGYAMRSIWVKKEDGNYRHTTLYLHKVLLIAPRGYLVDHANRRPLDNRKSNLRLATREQNTQNAKIRIDNTTGYKGVCWREKSRDFVAYINVNGKRVHLKTYKRVEDAISARKEAEIKYHGQFALSRNGG